MKKALLFLTVTFCLHCTQNNSLKNDTLISKADADVEFSLILFAKEIEYFSTNAQYNISASIDRVSATFFPQKDTFELYFAVRAFITENCKLRKIILFKDSLIKGELNVCSVHKW